MFTKAFLQASFERAVKTFAQTLVVLWAGNAGFDIINVNIEHSLSLAGGAALLSVLTSIASSAVGPDGPSLGGETIDPTGPLE